MKTLICIIAALTLTGGATAAPFYGPPVGAQKKACAASGGTWVPYLQVCRP